jgi:hypothetical protein
MQAEEDAVACIQLIGENIPAVAVIAVPINVYIAMQSII